MRWWSGKSPLFPTGGKSLKVLKIVIIISPALFFILLELLRRYVFKETFLSTWGDLSLFIIVLVATLFFSRLVFTVINRFEKENMHRIRELATLSDVSQTLDEFHNLNALLNKAMEKLIQITGADSGELYLVDEQSHELVHAMHGGILDDVFKREMQLQLRERLIGEGVRLNQQVIMEHLEDFQNGLTSSFADVGLRSWATIPLKSRSGIIGVVCLFSLDHDNFRLNEAKLLLEIGNRVAVAIEKARLYQKVQAVAVLEERERISAELHDGLAQVLGYVITKSQATRQLLKKMTAATEYLVELENVAQEVYTDTREAILGLRTAVSGDRSLVSALREYATRFNQMHSIKTDLEVGDRIIPSMSPQIELQAIRIVQEALSNVRKHAEATRAAIKIVAGENQVTLTIEDDGKGFNTNNTDKGDWTKFGLRNMKERAQSIHGSLFIESKPETGTKITLDIPLNLSQTAVEKGE